MPSSILSDDDTDKHLMTLIAEGDELAFEKFVKKHQGAVIRTVAKMMGNSSESEDIAQQVFIRFWKSAKRYQPHAKLTTWLYTIVRNLVFNASKKRNGDLKSRLIKTKTIGIKHPLKTLPSTLVAPPK